MTEKSIFVLLIKVADDDADAQDTTRKRDIEGRRVVLGRGPLRRGRRGRLLERLHLMMQAEGCDREQGAPLVCNRSFKL